MRKLFTHPITLRTRRIVKAAMVVCAVALAVAIVTSITVDLGPVLRHQAEVQGSKLIKRPMHIGRLQVYLVSGTFELDDFVIEGLTPDARPFLTAKRITLSMPWSTLLDRRVVFDTIEMTDWKMCVEMFKDGHHSFPDFRQSNPRGKSRWTTTLQYVRAYRGEFTYDDHGMPWQVVTRNLDVTVARPSTEYRGSAKFSDGSVSFQDYVPFRIDMDSTFKVEDGLVKFDQIDLRSTGAQTRLVGTVDLAHWPEQSYQMTSKIDFPAQKAIWFAHDAFTVTGVGDFAGTFRMFKDVGPDGRSRTGRELKGTFTAPLTGVNAYRFSDLKGSVLWTPEVLEVGNATTTLYDGSAKFRYVMAMGQDGARTQNTFDASYQNVDLARFGAGLGFEGIRLAGRATGRNLLEWPLGLWSAHRGDGEIHVTAPSGATLMPRDLPVALLERRFTRPKPYGPFSSHLPLAPVPIGGDLVYRFGPDSVEVSPGWIATPETYVELEGRTAYGQDSHLPFHVSSADWQESDRVFAGILTAFGSRTGAIEVGGYGTFDGVMTKAFRDPRIEGTFTGEHLTAWDVDWGSARGAAVIENSYADVKGVSLRSGEGTIEADGRFSLGYPRRDGGEELDARIRIVDRPVADLRHAFGLDDYDLDGALSGEFHLYGDYQTPLGFGTMTIAGGVAYGEPFDSAAASLRFEGDGIRLDNIQLAKSSGRATGAAYVGWHGTYSFSLGGRNIPVESVAAAKRSPVPLSGLIDFTAGGSGTFAMPRYDVHGTVRDFFARDEGIGQIVGDIDIAGDLMTLKFEAASSRLAVSGNGHVALTDAMDADVTFNVVDTSIDPYVRAYDPGFSPYTTAVASGTVRVVGELTDLDHLLVDATIDKLDARLFDYQLRNETPIRIALDRNAIRIAEMTLVGDGTELNVDGLLGLRDRRIAVRARGDANLAVLQGFVSNVRSSGHAYLTASIEGAMDDPAVTGTLRVDDGRIRHFALPHSLDNITGEMRFDARGVTLDGLTATLGDGPVQFFGRIDKQGLLPGRLDVTMTGQGMHLRFPEGMRSLVDATLMLQGTVDSAALTGDVYVRDAVYTRDFDEELLSIGGVAGASAVAAPAAIEALPLRYDIRISAPQSLQVRNNLFRLVASADLQLRGTYARPALIGRAEVNRGDLLFEGKRYLVTHGTVDFNNPEKIEPFFDIEVETRVRVPDETYVIAIHLTGTPTRLAQPEITSDPPLPLAEALALLFSDVAPGQDVELRQYSTSVTPQEQLVRERATRALTGTISSEVGRVVEQTFGVDTFQLTPTLVDPNAQSVRGLDPAARVTIGKRLSERTYLTYSRSLSSSTRDQIILLEYDQTDRLSWILSRNEDRTYAIDVRVRHVF